MWELDLVAMRRGRETTARVHLPNNILKILQKCKSFWLQLIVNSNTVEKLCHEKGVVSGIECLNVGKRFIWIVLTSIQKAPPHMLRVPSCRLLSMIWGNSISSVFDIFAPNAWIRCYCVLTNLFNFMAVRNLLIEFLIFFLLLLCCVHAL